METITEKMKLNEIESLKEYRGLLLYNSEVNGNRQKAILWKNCRREFLPGIRECIERSEMSSGVVSRPSGYVFCI